MANRRMEFLIGMTVLTVFVTIVIMTILFGSNHNNLFQFNHGQKMSILFDKAPGIKNTSRVTKSGIEIGRVFRSDLIDDQNGTQVRVYFTLNDPKTKIFTNEQARIKPSLIMGDAEIEFVKNRQFQGDIHEVTPDDVIVGISGSDIMGTVNNIEGDLKDAIQSINMTAQEAARFIGNLNDFMGTDTEIKMKKEKLTAIFTELGDTLKSARGLATNMNDIISDPKIKENIRKSAGDIPNILAKVDSLLTNGETLFASVQDTIDHSQETIDKIGMNLDNIGDFTNALSSEGPEFITNLNASSKDINKMVRNIGTLSENIVNQMNNKATPIGMLTDEEVGASLHGIVRNVETTTEKVQPILDDARVFTNKIAHRPSSLIFSKSTYKGEPSLSERNYNYQPYSPGGGMNSPLYTQSNAYYPSETPNRYSGDNGAGDPNTLENYYATHPETARVIQREKNYVSGCLTDKLGSFSLCKRNKEEKTRAGYSTDPAEYYGLSDNETIAGDGATVTQADLAPGEYLIGDDAPRAEKSCLSKDSGNCASKVKFSLASAFHKVFKCRDHEDVVTDQPAPLPMDVVYQPGDWSQADRCGVTEPTCEPGCDSGNEMGGGYGAPSQIMSETSEFSFPTDSQIQSPIQNENGPQTEVLPEKAIRRSNEDAAYQASPVNPGYSGNESGTNQNNAREIPLGPLPQTTPQKATPAGNGLPAPIKRPQKLSRTSSVADRTMTSSAPAPIILPSRAFIDDGLPIQFTPNH